MSFRVSLATGLSSVGYLLGSVLASLFTKFAATEWSYFYGMLFCTLIYGLAIIYTQYYVRETFVGVDEVVNTTLSTGLCQLIFYINDIHRSTETM
jgi:hypothetical protein